MLGRTRIGVPVRVLAGPLGRVSTPRLAVLTPPPAPPRRGEGSRLSPLSAPGRGRGWGQRARPALAKILTGTRAASTEMATVPSDSAGKRPSGGESSVCYANGGRGVV